MAMSAFHSRCPVTAVLDTRSITVFSDPKIPKGDYGFFESYCPDPGCDCRRVMLFVYSRDDLSTVLATINYGWESVAFYTKWIHGDAETAEEMTRPTLEPFGEQSEFAEELLGLARTALIGDPNYVEQLKRHYAEFRAASPREERPRRTGLRGPAFTPPRNKKKRR